jgi:hypothetical protein
MVHDLLSACEWLREERDAAKLFIPPPYAVWVAVSTELVDQLREWSESIQVRIEPRTSAPGYEMICQKAPEIAALAALRAGA